MHRDICDNETTDTQIYHLAVARLATSLICLTLGLPILGLICARKLFKTATQRQYLYLVLATEAYLLALACGVDRIFTDYTTHDGVCAALGFLTQWASITELFFTFSIIVVLHLAILRKHVHLAPNFCLRKFSERYQLVLEVTFVIISIVSPPIINWLPYKDHTYGLSGAWCWIISLDNLNNCTDVGFVYQLSLNYVPTFFISAAIVVLTVVTNVVLCHAACKHRDMSYHHRKRAKEVALLLLCIILSSSLIVPEIVTRAIINYHNSYDSPYAVVMLYAVGTPLGRLVLSCDLLLYLYSFNIISGSEQTALCKCCSHMYCPRKYHRLYLQDSDISSSGND